MSLSDKKLETAEAKGPDPSLSDKIVYSPKLNGPLASMVILKEDVKEFIKELKEVIDVTKGFSQKHIEEQIDKLAGKDLI